MASNKSGQKITQGRSHAYQEWQSTPGSTQCVTVGKTAEQCVKNGML
jgi:hypothetical protein